MEFITIPQSWLACGDSSHELSDLYSWSYIMGRWLKLLLSDPWLDWNNVAVTFFLKLSTKSPGPSSADGLCLFVMEMAQVSSCDTSLGILSNVNRWLYIGGGLRDAVESSGKIYKVDLDKLCKNVAHFDNPPTFARAFLADGEMT